MYINLSIFLGLKNPVLSFLHFLNSPPLLSYEQFSCKKNAYKTFVSPTYATNEQIRRHSTRYICSIYAPNIECVTSNYKVLDQWFISIYNQCLGMKIDILYSKGYLYAENASETMASNP